MDFFVGMAFGALGGALLGIKGYLDVYKEQPWSWEIFLKSMTLPMIVGVVAGVYAQTPQDALIAGFLGKIAQEIANAHDLVPNVIKVGG